MSALRFFDQAFRIPIFYTLYYKIAEPRVIRLMLFGIYMISLWAGIRIGIDLPPKLISVVGPAYVFGFAVLVILGAFASALAVLPGVWWLERVGLILLVTGVVIYDVMLVNLDATPAAVGFVACCAIFLLMRWVDIRGAQLAPRRK